MVKYGIQGTERIKDAEHKSQLRSREQKRNNTRLYRVAVREAILHDVPHALVGQQPAAGPHRAQLQNPYHLGYHDLVPLRVGELEPATAHCFHHVRKGGAEVGPRRWRRTRRTSSTSVAFPCCFGFPRSSSRRTTTSSTFFISFIRGRLPQ